MDIFPIPCRLKTITGNRSPYNLGIFHLTKKRIHRDFEFLEDVTFRPHTNLTRLHNCFFHGKVKFTFLRKDQQCEVYLRGCSMSREAFEELASSPTISHLRLEDMNIGKLPRFSIKKVDLYNVIHDGNFTGDVQDVSISFYTRGEVHLDSKVKRFRADNCDLLGIFSNIHMDNIEMANTKYRGLTLPSSNCLSHWYNCRFVSKKPIQIGNSFEVLIRGVRVTARQGNTTIMPMSYLNYHLIVDLLDRKRILDNYMASVIGDIVLAYI